MRNFMRHEADQDELDDALGHDRAWAVYLLAGVLASIALVATVRLASGAADPILALPVPLLVIAFAFAVSERFPIHFELRSEAHSFSLSTIPLVIGLFALDPVGLVVARLAGSALVLVLHRRQVLMKLAMNLASFWLEVVVALWVFGLIVPESPLSGQGWVAAIAAGMASDLIQVLVIGTAIAIYVKRFDRREMVPTMVATIGAFIDTCLALVAVTLIVEAPQALPLLAVMPVALWLSYSAYSNLHEKHRSLEEVYDFTRTLSGAGSRGTVVETLLAQAADLLHADDCWLFLAAPEGGGRRWTLGPDGHAISQDLKADCVECQIHDLAVQRHPALVDADGAGDELAVRLRMLGHNQAMVARLSGTTGNIATLVVADRSGEVRPFLKDDLRLFEALVHQAGVALDNAELIHRLRTEAAANEYQSLHDALTDLPNRSYFDRSLNDSLAADAALAVLLLDLDRFKEVNDTLGHHNGDLLLQEVGARLRAVLRRNDVVARLGGDEFAVLVTDLASPEAAVHVASAVRAVLERPIRLGEVEVAVGASIGIAVAPQHGTTAEVVMQRADVAMYQAKDSGSGIALYDPDRDEYSPARLALVGELRAAVAERQIQVHYQPLVDLATGRVTGVEALARWSHPKRGPVPPDEFVRIAENTGLINSLTDIVLTEAVTRCAEWRQAGHMIRVSVNLSARNLIDPWLIDLVRSRLVMAGLPASALCLEITESCAMADPNRTWALLNRLGDLGCKVAIDDFGTGYSSLAYLKRLPVHEVKIDRSFVSTVGTPEHDSTDLVIVRAVSELSRSLGLRVVAEGVEREDSIPVLLDAGVQTGQGYLFSKPLTLDALTAWLEGRRGTTAPAPPVDPVVPVAPAPSVPALIPAPAAPVPAPTPAPVPAPAPAAAAPAPPEPAPAPEPATPEPAVAAAGASPPRQPRSYPRPAFVPRPPDEPDVVPMRTVSSEPALSGADVIQFTRRSG
jgi:diguanylate cyclase (GGDEF)-like protein